MTGQTPPRDQRVDAVIPVRFADAKEFLVEYTSNISLGGVFVRTANPSAFGTVVRLSLELPGTGQSVPVTGQVAFVLPADQAARQGKVPGMGVRFARLDPAVQETLAAYVEGLQRKSKGRVLLVDDDALGTQKLADLLRSYHLNVTTVSSAVKALEILRFGGIDFIISDIVMPRMDGFEFRDNLRNNPKTASIPFVFLTASESPADMQLAAELGVQYFLRKPVDAGPLLALLKQVLGEAAFLPDAPGSAPEPSAEKAQRKKVQERRIVEIAYRKFVALGLDTRFTADERGVFGQLVFRAVSIQDPATGNRLERAGLYSVGHDRAKPFWPRALGALPMFNILDIPDAATLERTLAVAFQRRIDAVRQVKQFLDAYRIPNRYDAGTMRVLGQVKTGRDEIVFSVRDPKTVFLESLNGHSFGEVAAMRARLVDISDAKSGVDVEIALETACRRLQESMQQPSGTAAPAAALSRSGQREVVLPAELTSETPDEIAAPPPRVAMSAPAPVAAKGEWIGEPEEDESQLSPAAPPSPPPQPSGAAPTASPAPRPAALSPPPQPSVAAPAPPRAATPSPAPQPSVTASPPAEPAPARPPAPSPAPQPAVFAPPPEAPPSPPSAEEMADAEGAALAAAAIDMATKAAVAASIAAATAPAETPLEALAAEPASADSVWPEEPAATSADGGTTPFAPTADDVWPERPPEPEATPFDEPAPPPPPEIAAAAAGDAGDGMDDWSAYATPDAEPANGSAIDTPLEMETAPGTALAAGGETAPDSPQFSGAEFELAGTGTAAGELELAAPAAPPPEASLWTARDLDAPAETAPVLEVDAPAAPPPPPEPAEPPPDPPAAARTVEDTHDMDSTFVPTEAAEESPEEVEARKWADEWTGDEATAEPLWTIQPGEESIRASADVTSALAAPDGGAAPPPGPTVGGMADAAPAAASGASMEPAAGMTPMVCTTCGATYYIGDEIDDERLLLVCPTCIAKS